jgi:prevent-host-death family protein
MLTGKPAHKIITATHASNHFGRLIDEAARGLSSFIVTRMGHPTAVILGIDQYRALLEELEATQEIHDEAYMAGVAEAREDIELGRTLTLAELDSELGFTEEELGSAAS